MKNEKKTQNANTKKDDAKTKKSSSKTTSAPTIYGCVKETVAIQTFSASDAKADLSNFHTKGQIEKMLSGQRDVLPSETIIYSVNSDKLAEVIEKKGWGNLPDIPETEQAETSADQEGEQAEPENAEAEEVNDLTYDIEEIVETLETDTTNDFDLQADSESAPAEIQSEPAGTAEEKELDLSDPNQVIFDAYRDNTEFAHSLNQKETKLFSALVEGKKVVASFSENENKMWESVKAKYDLWFADTQSDKATGDDGQEPIENFRTAESLALEKKASDDAEIAPADLPMSEAEKSEYEALNAKFKATKDAFDAAPFAMMEIASEIRAKQLFREHYTSIKEWAEKEHGITREYAQQLAQFGDFRAVLADIGETPLLMAGTVNSTKEWAQDTNKIAKQLGIKASEYDVMKPIIEAVSGIISEVAVDDQGNLNSVAPRIFAAANDKIPDIIKSGVVEINGEQMLISEAVLLGEEVITEAIKVEIIETVAEGIKSNKQEIVDYIKESKTNRTKPHDPVLRKSVAENTDYYKGVVPSQSANCSNHPITEQFKDNFVNDVFNAGFELACGCRWQKIEGYDGFQCIQCEGKPVFIA